MDLTVSGLTGGFREAGVDAGDHILVHSSLSSLGWVEGGADTVVSALIEAAGSDGTVLFPTLTGVQSDAPECPPVFDARCTRCWTGRIPETARTRPGGVRSLHPTHSVTAFGSLAPWFASGHERVRTPCGFGSPYDKLADVGGKIVLIGCTQSTNTSFHHAEEVAGVPYVCQDELAQITFADAAGSPITVNTLLHRHRVERDYDHLEPEMVNLGICYIAKVGQAEVRVMDAGLQRIFLVRKLLADPLATLSLAERGRWA